MIFKKHTQKKERTSLSVTTRFDKKKRRKFNLNNSLSEFLDIAGVDEKPTVFNKRIIKVDIIIMSLLILTIIIFAIIFKTPILRVIASCFL